MFLAYQVFLMKQNVYPANKESVNNILKVYISCIYAEYIEEKKSLPFG
jgi:hypothetical protein